LFSLKELETRTPTKRSNLQSSNDVYQAPGINSGTEEIAVPEEQQADP
jgi:hypothetical protein